ncbi:L-serine dehydratase [Parabacteroides sp. PF5-5]|uniref:L-serine ammonia-lyase n=1 Tax=unclassified Parabacteroides TaxID=2649774 RepID=UPI002475640E|nr:MULTISPECIES: L-serine ammonia-lyase [unclassified Parabacteroides]MDH6305852.1 L-serine dehydratase [Parabacteroides sp. PH5-39]MDH6317334.1 L-serine dehydratase [Parabacteroides sp. PF5-13]MDH6320542.1 L-serine dehydratase [Parabacteroides sp. PH5-13]MDH6324295.1 L-serine dehydratase [Parabacteroides sp. PH5-8]MDH6328492.1 L-serine dehydratase [Parabacteroides sp. PH5-41]
MESIKQIFRIGHGPSSSHTMGPRRAAQMFLERNKEAARFTVTLYGSLAATGVGHMTDKAILEILEPVAPTTLVWEPQIVLPFHPNGMFFESFDSNDKMMEAWSIYSIGGGTLANETFNEQKTVDIYEMSTIREIQQWCQTTGHSYWEYVEQREGSEIWDYLNEVWKVMQEAVLRGLETEGIIPGGLGIRRKASDYLIRAKGYGSSIKSRGMVYAFALAVSEENACGGKIVTAPTCGSCGVMPSVLYHLKDSREFRDSRILHALATAGLFGNVVRTNASISGAEVGCQGEIGVACAMAAAAASQLFGGTAAQIEYAAEMGLEHHLGLTCDPVCGLVQIPCIERNAFAAARALDANTYSNFSDGRHRVSFDQVVEVMRQTGHDLPSLYKETSEGGLAIVKGKQ